MPSDLACMRHGTLVKCIARDWNDHYPARLVVGSYYTVRELLPDRYVPGVMSVLLVGNPTPWPPYIFEVCGG